MLTPEEKQIRRNSDIGEESMLKTIGEGKYDKKTHKRVSFRGEVQMGQ
jgi:hypothetical protein